MTTFGKVERGIGPYWLDDGTRLWRVVYRVGRKQRSRGGFPTATAADKWRADNIVQRQQGTYIDTTKGNMTVGSFADKWFAKAQQGIGVRRPLRPKTVKWYDTLLRRHIKPHLGDVRFSELTTEVVEDWLATLHAQPSQTRSGHLSQSTVAKAYRLLHEMCDAAVRLKHLPMNPCQVKGAGSEAKPDASRYEDVVSAETVLALADQMKDVGGARTHRTHAHYRSLVLLAGFGGLRWAESIALRRRDVDQVDGTVKVRRQVEEISGRLRIVDYTKTDAGRRTVHLPAVVTAALRQHLATLPPSPDALLWEARPRAGVTNLLRHGNFMRSVWKPACRAVGVNLHWHDLRHIAGTLMAQAGVPTKTIMRQLGHESLAAAMRYQHATEASQSNAAERMNALLASSPASNATGTEGADIIDLSQRRG